MSTTIPLGAIIDTIARSRFEISVLIVANNIEIGRTIKIIATQNINSFQEINCVNTSSVNEDVININTVDTIMDDVLSIK